MFTYLAPNIHDQRVLTIVKTYPNLSRKYGELVCTAGLTPEGKWLRIYPIRFRNWQKMEQFRKYQWIKINLTKNQKDHRRESYRPVGNEKPELLEFVDTKNNWYERKRLVLNSDIYYEFIEPLRQRHKEALSIITFKPEEITNFTWETTEKDWSDSQKAYFDELDFFEEKPTMTNLKKLPYKFYYHFIDKDRRKHKMMIEDWETGMLYWNCLKKTGLETDALNLVKKKYLDEFAGKREVYLFLGTTLKHHYTARNPFMIIGIFNPPIVDCEQIEIEL